MIKQTELTDDDIGRRVIYRRGHCTMQEGMLSSWNGTYIFVRFNGPDGEACLPEDISFISEEIPNAPN